MFWCLQVSFCFHGDDKHTLPLWVMQEGQVCPDMFFTDRAGMRNTECLSLGVDHGEPVGWERQLLQYSVLKQSIYSSGSRMCAAWHRIRQQKGQHSVHVVAKL